MLVHMFCVRSQLFLEVVISEPNQTFILILEIRKAALEVIDEHLKNKTVK